ncbi:hypothetical protein TNCV_4034331 [Trichonephila clavipes]|nr:hypothetical protein TNCV_4034331 [Trichonephila clavipes]
MKLIYTSTLDRAQRLSPAFPHMTPKIADFSPLDFRFLSADAIDTNLVFPPSVLSNLHRNEAQLYIESSVWATSKWYLWLHWFRDASFSG